MDFKKTGVVMLLSLTVQGCLLTKVVSVPMRLGGAVISIVPVAGDAADDVIDSVADVVDSVPI